MAYYRRGRYGRRPAKKAKRIPRKQRVYARARVSRLKKQVQSIMSSMVETKQAFHTTGDTLVKFNSGIDSAGDMLQILPSISQSLLDNGRVGDQIRAQSLNVKGFVKLDINNTVANTTMPTVAVRMMIVSMKVRSNYLDATSAPTYLGTLLKKGGTTTGFTGALRDLYAPINTDAFTKHYDRIMYLTQDAVISPNGTANPGINAISSDVRKTIKFFNINVRCKKKLLKYDSNITSLTPTNWAPFLVLGYCYLDGSTIDTISTKVGLQYDSIFNYEDA